MERYAVRGGKVSLYKREDSRFWQCAVFVGGKYRRKSTKEDSLSHAREIAEDWYLELRGKLRIGALSKGGKAFQIAAKQFWLEYPVITEGQRNSIYVKNHRRRIDLHLLPFFGAMALADITAGTVQEYRVHRLTSRKHPKTGAPIRPSRSTMHQEIVVLRQILKTAQRHGWLETMPDLSPPYKTAGKISHRAWFSATEYRQLYEATRERAKKPLHGQWRWECEQLHDFVLFMANTGLRPDEALRLEYRDVSIVKDQATNETILEIEVRGKRGVGFCKSMPGAVLPFRRLKKRNSPRPADRVFPHLHRELFNTILRELDLKKDRDGNPRTAYSLRHTYICFRLMEGADIYQVAKNCRTSVEMIEKYYAVHLKNTLDAAAINVRKSSRNAA